MRRTENGGFTLVELLVAMAVLIVLMGGLALLYVNSLKAVRQTMQQVDAFERARGALATLTTDLTTGYGARANAQVYSFYGTPIGMTFVTLVKNSPDAADANIARVTYVLYNMYYDAERNGTFPQGEEAPEYRVFEDALEANDPAGVSEWLDGWANAYTYVLIRYVEPNVGDIDAFPVEWNQIPFPGNEQQTLDDVVEAEVAAALSANLIPSTGSPEAEDVRKMKRRELWIRMLAGGDHDVPNGWRLPYSLIRLGPDPGVEPVHVDPMRPYRYVVTENILSFVHGGAHWGIGYPPTGNLIPWYEGAPIFDYDMAFAMDGDPNSGFVKSPNLWWNDVRSNNCKPPEGAPTVLCRDPRKPEVVSVSFWMMFESPYPGAPDFKRKFSTRIMIPTAYDRQDEVL